MTLEHAWALAEKANPGIRAAQASLPAVQGLVTDSQGALWNNPQVLVDTARRTIPQAGLPALRTNDLTVGLAQTFEIAGQQSLRRESSRQELAAVRESIEETRRQIRGAVEQRFVRVLALQLRVATEDEAIRLFEDAARAVEKQAAAGEASRLDRNLAQVEAERARNQRTVLNEGLNEARADLAVLLQLPPEELPTASGELAAAGPVIDLDALLEGVERRPLLRSLSLRTAAASSRLDLERAAVYPDITVGMSYGHEGGIEGRTGIATLSVSVPLPVFRRNASGIGRATTELEQAKIERQTAGRDARAHVFVLWKKRESAQGRVDRLERVLVERLDENQRLADKARRVGEIGLLQLIVVNRQVLDGRRDLLEARTDLRLATIALKLAAGGFEGSDR